jgi:hypothetical protein
MFDGFPLLRLLILEILYPDNTVCVSIFATFLAIELLVFVWAFLRLAHKEAFIYTADATILETADLLTG